MSNDIVKPTRADIAAVTESRGSTVGASAMPWIQSVHETRPRVRDPLDILASDILFWGRSDTMQGVSDKGSQITDRGKLGNHFTQATAAKRPSIIRNVYQGHAGLRFRQSAEAWLSRDGTGFDIALPSQTAGRDIWIIGAWPTSTQSNGSPYAKIGNLNGEDYGWLVLDRDFDNANKASVQAANAANSILVTKSNTAVHDGAIHCIRVASYGATIGINVDNDTAVASDYYSRVAPGPIAIGAWVDAVFGWDTSTCDLDWLETIHATRACNNASSALMAAYVLDRYGLVVKPTGMFGF